MTPMPDDNYAQRTNHDYIGLFGRIPNEPKTVDNFTNLKTADGTVALLSFVRKLLFQQGKRGYQ